MPHITDAIDASTPFRLLELPPELRLVIYAFTFQSVIWRFAHSQHVKDLEPTDLLQVCREVRSEAAPQWGKWIYDHGHELYPEQSEDNDTTDENDTNEDRAKTVDELLDGVRKTLHKMQAGLRTARCSLVVKLRCETRAERVTSEYAGTVRQGIESIDAEIAKSVALYESYTQRVAALQAGG